MLKSKITLYAIIALFFLLGVYEKKMGDVLDIPANANALSRPDYLWVSGDMLIILAVGLFLACTYALDKE